MKFENNHPETENIEIGCMDKQGNGKSYPLNNASVACSAEVFGRGTSEDFAATILKFPYEGQIPSIWENLNIRVHEYSASRELSANKNYQSFQKDAAKALKGRLPLVDASK